MGNVDSTIKVKKKEDWFHLILLIIKIHSQGKHGFTISFMNDSHQLILHKNSSKERSS